MRKTLLLKRRQGEGSCPRGLFGLPAGIPRGEALPRLYGLIRRGAQLLIPGGTAPVSRGRVRACRRDRGLSSRSSDRGHGNRWSPTTNCTRCRRRTAPRPHSPSGRSRGSPGRAPRRPDKSGQPLYPPPQGDKTSRGFAITNRRLKNARSVDCWIYRSLCRQTRPVRRHSGMTVPPLLITKVGIDYPIYMVIIFLYCIILFGSRRPGLLSAFAPSHAVRYRTKTGLSRFV